MIKYYCDRCSKETEKLTEVTIPEEKVDNKGSFRVKSVPMCIECAEKAEKIYPVMTDIRILVFERFMSNIAENIEPETRLLQALKEFEEKKNTDKDGAE